MATPATFSVRTRLPAHLTLPVNAHAAHPTPPTSAFLCPSDATDDGLLARIRSDDPTAFDDLVRVYHPRIGRLVYRLCAWSRAESEDLTQEVFLRVLSHLHQFDGRSSLATWLTTIAINTVRSARRTRIRRAGFWAELLLRRRSDESNPADLPDESAEEAERNSRVAAAIRRLPAKYREPVILRYLEELDPADIATSLGLSRSTLDVRLHRARELLKSELADLMNSDP